ncbi:hypothetical protein [Sphingosinicella microcystinivorans]|uniref:Uncharacterized protein n=1 Tax=Sphingosinicella microcystinivorans TaxID=335406 RepID=A0AAD1FZT6_SPHMI|nr:hypothetical protein [Sphingosinicella microcystinivorans]RKS89149.1 hypothetical protein DFR51_2363 [Sphingosinicella microcystinivorans]BBE32905.1 hypothetical protein SmB9_05630 [Sphingosinicella microcystinivorans]
MGFYLKDPGARIDYTVDWAAGYLAGDTIAASVWIVAPEEPGGIAVDGAASEAGRASATLQGGIPGHVYRVTNRVTLTSGRIEERALSIRVDER